MIEYSVAPKGRSRQEASESLLPPDIAWIEGRCFSFFRSIVSVLLIIATGGLFLLFIRWSVRIYTLAWFKICPLESATRILIAAKPSTSPISSSKRISARVSYTLLTIEQKPTSSWKSLTHRGDRCVWKSDQDAFVWTANLLDNNGISGCPSNFLPISELNSNLLGELKHPLHGLSNAEAAVLLDCFGPNTISMAQPMLFSLILSEVISPLVLFQSASVALWCLENYWAYACAIAFITAVSIILSIRTTLSSMASLSKLANDSGIPPSIFIIRGDDQRQGSIMGPVLIPASMIVPGDLIILDHHGHGEYPIQTLPCDGILVRGEALVDESFLTGESIPITKTTANLHGHDGFEMIENSSPSLKRLQQGNIDRASLVYGGTRLLEATGGAMMRATATGSISLRGRMLKAMRYPPPLPSVDQLHIDALIFMGVLGAISIIGFVTTVALLPSNSLVALLVRAGDLITVVLPPALPASLALGTGFAIRRLAQRGIICTAGVMNSGGSGNTIGSPINVAGRVQMVLFDKTGTLTEDSLDVLWVSEAKNSSNHSGVVRLMQVGSSPSSSRIRGALATCHTLRMLGGNLVGDPLDVTLFTWSGWNMEYNTHGLAQIVVTSGNPSKLPSPGDQVRLAVVRAWPFCPLLRRTTVIVKRISPNANSAHSSEQSHAPSSSLQVFVKGAPESLLALCDPTSVPESFLETTLPAWTRRGYRVILFAGGMLPLSSSSWVAAQRLTRAQAEEPKGQLRFLGAVVLVNSVKRGSWETIARLTKAGLAVGMATGDHAVTAAAVAQQVGIIASDDDHNDGVIDARSRPVAVLSGSGFWVNERNEAIRPVNDDSFGCVSKGSGFSSMLLPVPPGYVPVVSGGDALAAYLKAIDSDPSLSLIDGPVRVFARLSPDDKRLLVESMTATGAVVAFCGDGANDVAALQVADVGISLSTSTDSLVAPFCSTGDDPRCVLDVLIEGRGSLGVSFACFRFMALYSMIQFTVVSLLYTWGMNLSDGQFIWQDLFVILPLATAIARMRPGSGGLSSGRLPGRLVDPSVLVAMLVQIVLQILLLFLLYAISVRIFPPHAQILSVCASDDLSAFEGNMLNSSIFLFSNFQYLLMALIFGTWPPFQEPVYANFLMVGLILALIVCNFSILLSCETSLMSTLFGTVDLPSVFRIGVISGLIVLDVALSIFLDSLITPMIISLFHRKKKRNDKLSAITVS
ncbi:Ca-transporting ATPase [Mitosporidium daphniae]|uniref:Cation-transporting ATPase n=1 Tax=Mitosporidium daphniae TaxID=1485682 RepID=A0A098VW51_9MICR|nr:Ca-transporting ATPase [Mitosporidium daphniae]KGG51951.1 Ca-transporting ATPase [Mitosporidium daphniae]|eukprot:XP_013238378.1 Ca-transporting ATPase [Mitosporidium daphniae]